MIRCHTGLGGSVVSEGENTLLHALIDASAYVACEVN